MGRGVEKNHLESMENMEGKEVVDVSNLIENPEISLHAITKSFNPKTMRVKDKIGIRWITILIDS